MHLELGKYSHCKCEFVYTAYAVHENIFCVRARAMHVCVREWVIVCVWSCDCMIVWLYDCVCVFVRECVYVYACACNNNAFRTFGTKVSVPSRHLHTHSHLKVQPFTWCSRKWGREYFVHPSSTEHRQFGSAVPTPSVLVAVELIQVYAECLCT